MWSLIRGYSHPSSTSMICCTDVGKWVLRKGEKKERSMLCLKTQAHSSLFSFSLLPVKTPLLELKSVFLRPILWLALAFWFLFQRLIVSRFSRQINFCYSCVADACSSDAAGGEDKLYLQFLITITQPLSEIITWAFVGVKRSAWHIVFLETASLSYFAMCLKCWKI